jgi:hypothetical protein
MKNGKLQQFCGDCVVADCRYKDSASLSLPRCPADQQAVFGDDLINPREPLSCPVCGSLINESIPHGALLARAQARLKKLHPACLKCGDCFSFCEGTTSQEWEDRLTDPEQSDDPFCHKLAFWP